MNTPQSYMRETSFGRVLRECQLAVDGFVIAAMRDNFDAETERTTHEKPHRLDEVGSADAARIIVREQVKGLLVHFGTDDRLLPQRLRVASKLCREHLRRSAEMGVTLADADVFKCMREIMYFIRALHLVLRSEKANERDQIAGLYWQHKDPTAAARHLAIPMTPTVH